MRTRDLLRGAAGLFSAVEPRRFINGVKDYFGSEFVFTVSSGRAALVLILRSLSSLRPARKVVIPAYTCYSVPSAIVKSGLEVVPCDVDPDTLDFDYARLEDLADDRTLCIISTHLFGIPSDLDRTRRICMKKGIFLVEDAAQAMGSVTHDGRKLGTVGDVGFFSLGRGKNITCGTGGFIITCSKEIARACCGLYNDLDVESFQESVKSILALSLMQIFMNPYIYWLPDGLPFLGIGESHFDSNIKINRMSRAKHELLLDWDRNLEASNDTRMEISETYKDSLQLDRKIKIYAGKNPCLRFPVYLKNEEVKYDLCKRFRHLGISPMYPGSINAIRELSRFVGNCSCPSSAMLAGKLVTLPTNGFVDGSLIKKICSAISGSMDNKYLNTLNIQ